MIARILFLTLLAASPLAAHAGPPEARPLRVVPLEGVPSDATIRAEFMAGFEQALTAETFDVEVRDAAGEWRPDGNRPNRFVRTDDPKADRAWTLQVVVRAPPPFSAKRYNRATKKTERHVNPDLRASRGMTLAITTLSPEAITAGARVAPEQLAFAFPQERAPAGVVGNAAEGFRFPWRDAGRAAAMLSLELLHRNGGDLGEATRADLTPATRAGTVR